MLLDLLAQSLAKSNNQSLALTAFTSAWFLLIFCCSERKATLFPWLHQRAPPFSQHMNMSAITLSFIMNEAFLVWSESDQISWLYLSSQSNYLPPQINAGMCPAKSDWLDRLGHIWISPWYCARKPGSHNYWFESLIRAQWSCQLNWLIGRYLGFFSKRTI